MIKIENTWYNESEISRMTFEEFCSIIPNKTKEFKENIYFKITGKKQEPVIEKKKFKKDISAEVKE